MAGEQFKEQFRNWLEAFFDPRLVAAVGAIELPCKGAFIGNSNANKNFP